AALRFPLQASGDVPAWTPQLGFGPIGEQSGLQVRDLAPVSAPDSTRPDGHVAPTLSVAATHLHLNPALGFRLDDDPLSSTLPPLFLQATGPDGDLLTLERLQADPPDGGLSVTGRVGFLGVTGSASAHLSTPATGGPAIDVRIVDGPGTRIPTTV